MSTHKNIVLLIADDLGREVLGCYGSKAVDTPHLDSIAASGTRFDFAFASTASCSGSRTTIYTGLHTHNNGSYGLVGERNGFQTNHDIETAPQIFNDIGYKTGILGKVHVAPDAQYPWQVRKENDTRDVAFIADQAKEFMQEAKNEDKPFFLTIGYVDPHRDLAFRGGFGNVEGNYDPRLKDKIYTPDQVVIPSWTNDLPEVRQELAEYYRSIYRMDQGIGMVVQNLQDLGLADNTMIVFMSDNGPPFINSKTTLYDAGVRLPLLVRVPGRSGGIINHHMVSWLDVLPTFLDWAGHAGRQPAAGYYGPRTGRSIIPIMENPTQDVDPSWSRVFGSHTFHEITNYWPTRYMRDRRYKYHRNICWRLDFPFAMDLYASLSFEGIRNSGDEAAGKPTMVGQRKLRDYIFRPPEELYDLEADPAEVTNLADNPDYKEKLLEMRQALEQWQNETQDLWLWRDGTSVWRYRYHGYHREGLRIPDRFDFDVDNPGNRDPALKVVELDVNKL
ncbi:hypothetical protein jhhlp_006636 [Lomentospora prolificans]|uniref:Sulfatase N-terminal domain-containing protein n=1 Tax=Lomentospora prolificans TaxID=41688 RepID=A0A2N3N6I6_9PEZI|nr:hypothetical protein jhhlp_006636 [Lomentospora prolificans]